MKPIEAHERRVANIRDAAAVASTTKRMGLQGHPINHFLLDSMRGIALTP